MKIYFMIYVYLEPVQNLGVCGFLTQDSAKFAEKSDYASAAQFLCGVALKDFYKTCSIYHLAKSFHIFCIFT